MSRTGGPAALRTHHPVASRHPSSTRRGVCCVDLALLVEEGRTRQCRGQVVLRRLEPTTPSLRATPPRRGGECVALTLPSSRRRAGRDNVADRWSCGASNPTTPSLRATPPRRGGECVRLCPPRRGGQDVTVSRTGGPAASNPHTTPSLRATPPRGGGECVRLCPPRGGGQDATMSRTGGLAAPRPHPLQGGYRAPGPSSSYTSHSSCS